MPRVLCVDLDKTLTQKDVFNRTVSIWFRRGFKPIRNVPPLKRNQIKDWVYGQVNLQSIDWNFNQQVISLCTKAKDNYSEVILVTGNTLKAAEFFFEKFTFLDSVLASTNQLTLKGDYKATLLVSIYGKNNFDYIGNSLVDVKVWKMSNHAYVVKNNILTFKFIVIALKYFGIPFTILNSVDKSVLK